MSLGLLVAFIHKLKEGDEHLESWHEWVGAIFFISIIFQMILGLRIQLLPHNRFTIQHILQLAKYHKYLVFSNQEDSILCFCIYILARVLW